MCVGAPGFEDVVGVVVAVVAFVAGPDVGFVWDEWWCAFLALDGDSEFVASGAVWWFEHCCGSVGAHG